MLPGDFTYRSLRARMVGILADDGYPFDDADRYMAEAERAAAQANEVLGPEYFRNRRLWVHLHHPLRPSGVLDPVVEVALEALGDRVLPISGDLGAVAVKSIVEALGTLRAAGYALPSEEIEAWAIERRWGSDGASQLRSLAVGVRHGHRYQLEPGGPTWDPGTLEAWRARAAERKP